MAENKKGVIVYADWGELFDCLKDDEAGRLIKHFFNYVRDMNPTPPDRLTELSFIQIKQSLKRDLVKWEKASERSRENGKLGGRPVKEKTKITQQVISEPKKPDTDTVNVTDTVSVNVSDSEPPTLTASGKVFFIPSKLDDFKPPTFGEVKQCFSQQKPTDWDYTKSLVLSEKFYTNYEANGWKINGMPIGNWQALVKKWILKEIETPKNGNKQSVSDKAATGIELAKAALAQSLNKIAASRGFNNSEEVCSTANAKPYT